MKHEIIANIHIHTLYSDGNKSHKDIVQVAADCGLDVVIITDHNVFVRGFDGYYSFDGKRVLLITGEEIHDTNRIPQKNHLLALGVNHSHAKYAANPQVLINKISENGGLSFIAHPSDPELPAFDEDDLSWEDWSVRGYTGMEIWNNLSEFKFHVRSKFHAAVFAFFPVLMAVQPPEAILARWDELLNDGQRVVGIGGSDAHTIVYQFGPFRKEVFPYRYHFRTINTHILLERELSGSIDIDTKIILNALKNGNAFIANDSVKQSRGFRFNAYVYGKTVEMGSSTKFSKGMTIQARLPHPADIALMRNGEKIAEFRNLGEFEFPVTQPGVYRLETYRNYLFRRRGWIFSNPIYIE